MKTELQMNYLYGEDFRGFMCEKSGVEVYVTGGADGMRKGPGFPEPFFAVNPSSDIPPGSRCPASRSE